MNKFCKKHGQLNEEDIQIEKIRWITKDGEKKEGTQLRCRLCRREKDINWAKLHRTEKVEYSKKWKKENRDHYNAWVRQDRAKDPEKYKNWTKKAREKAGPMRSLKESLSLRNISLEEYNKLFEEQNGLCAICNCRETRKSRKEGNICRLTIDHCHSRQIVRGLLCHDCNTGIGKFKDNEELLLNAIAYLGKDK